LISHTITAWPSKSPMLSSISSVKTFSDRIQLINDFRIGEYCQEHKLKFAMMLACIKRKINSSELIMTL
jgi:hypothetical protein